MKKEKAIVTPELSIVGNVMSWKNSVIQLSNISSISTVPLELLPFPMWAIPLILIGLVTFKFSWITAIVLIASGVIAILYWYEKNKELETQKNLVILTNSGITFSFLFYNQEFLNQVFGVLSSIIAEKATETRNVKIYINSSTISGNAKILNDMIL